MSIEAWIASVTGIIAAAGTVILVIDTPFSRTARRAGGDLVALIKKRLGHTRSVANRVVYGHSVGVVATLILLAAWSLALTSLFEPAAARPLWSWISWAVAGAASVLALLLAYRKQPAAPAFDAQINARPADVDSNAQQKAQRRSDLLRQAYALAAVMLKYVPDAPGYVPWDDVQQFNGLIYRLGGEGLDVLAFEIPYRWTFEDNGSTDRFVEGPRVARQLEGLITYVRAAESTEPSDATLLTATLTADRRERES